MAMSEAAAINEAWDDACYQDDIKGLVCQTCRSDEYPGEAVAIATKNFLRGRLLCQEHTELALIAGLEPRSLNMPAGRAAFYEYRNAQ